MNIFEAGLDGVTFHSKGSKLLGGLYRAAGKSPRPTALLLHGLPGVEKNLDIAYGLREAGWNCLYFHYRGSWGSEGNYSLEDRSDDLHAATEWLMNQSCVDTDRLALIGHSAGGYLALTASALDVRYKAVVAICPLIAPLRAPLTTDIFNEFATMLNGITGDELQSQWNNLPSVETLAKRLLDRSVLLLTGRNDELFTQKHYMPLAEAVPSIEWHEFPNGDHALSLCRSELTNRTIKWLIENVGE